VIAEPPFNRNSVAAFFDLDGTLIPEPSLECRFFSALRKNGRIPITNYCRLAGEAVRLLRKGPLAVRHENKKYLAGVPKDLVFRYVHSILFFDEGSSRAAWHARQGHAIFLVSGTLEPLAQLAATALECELEARGVLARPLVSATRLQESCGAWTGRVSGEACYGRAKARFLGELAANKGIDLLHSHAYGNSLLDRHFLCAVGHAHAVNPSRDLAVLASQKNWPIWHWRQEKSVASPQSSHVPPNIPNVEEST
jgi:phosphoserine phosphatase